MTDQELKDLVANLAIAQQEMVKDADKRSAEADKRNAETDKKFQETEKLFNEMAKKTDKQLKELGQQIGGLGKKFGSFTEGLALPSMTKILTEQFGMTTINPSVRVRDDDGNEFEIDVLAYANGKINTAFIVEVKSHLREEGIDQLLNQCRMFPVWFPELANKKLFGILAAVDANQQLQKKVLEQGLYFAKIHDEQFSLCVPDDFKPFCFKPQ